MGGQDSSTTADAEAMAAEITTALDLTQTIGDTIFQKEVLQAFERVCELSASADETVPVTDVETWHRICVSRLVARADQRSMINYVEKLRVATLNDPDRFTAALKNHAFVRLYFLACFIDTEMIQQARDNKGSFFAYWDYQLSGDIFGIVSLWIDSEKNILYTEVPRRVFRLIDIFKASGNREAALRLNSNLLTFRTCAAVDEPEDSSMRKTVINMLLANREEIMRDDGGTSPTATDDPFDLL